MNGVGFALACAVRERARWPLWLPVALGVGIGVYFAWPIEPPFFAILAALVAGVLGAWTLWARGRTGAAFLCALLAVAVLGAALASARTWWVAHPVLSAETGPVTVTGQVIAVESRPKGARVTLGTVTIQGRSPAATPEQVRASLSGKQPVLRPGEWLRLRANLSPPPPPSAPGAFDFQRQSYFRGLGAVGFAFGPAEVIGGAPNVGAASLGFALQGWRLDLAARVRDRVAGSAGAVAAALITGDRGAIPDSVLDDMRASGLAHLLAISGLHVGLVAGIVFFAVRAGIVGLGLMWPAGWGRFDAKKAAAVAAVVGALFYTVLAGGTVPTRRAFVMIALVLMAVLVERRALSMRTVAWAALVILVLSPEALLGASFQLSFAAVVALVAVYEALSARGWFKRTTNGFALTIVRYVSGVAVTTMVAGAATAGFAAFHFNQVADYGLAANLVAVPVMALWIMPCAVAAFVLMPLGLDGWAFDLMGWGIEGVLAVAHTVAGWPGAQRAVPAFPVWALAALALGGVWAAIWRGPWRAWGAVPVALGMAALGFVRPPDVLVDGTGRLAAVRAADGGYAFSTLTAQRFARDVWLRRAGLEAPSGRWRPARLDDGQRVMQTGVLCDALGCVYRVRSEAGALTVAFVQVPDALAEDCARARVVVNLTDVPMPGTCAQGRQVVIDGRDLAQGGAHALYFDEEGHVRVETVAQQRGNRPWVVRPDGRRR